MDNRELRNSSGLYYVGIGTRLPAGDQNTINYTMNGEQWYFTKGESLSLCLLSLSSDNFFGYNIRALTKGCFFFNTLTDLFDSSNITVPFKAGDQYIQCNTHHLTTFSIGLKSPEFELEFNYHYVMDVKPLALDGLLLFGTVIIYFALCGILDDYISDKDFSQGRMRHLKDNRRGDRYLFVITVETGHHMYATTGSKVGWVQRQRDKVSITKSC